MKGLYIMHYLLFIFVLAREEDSYFWSAVNTEINPDMFFRLNQRVHTD